MKSALNDLDGSESELTDSTVTSSSCNEETSENGEEETDSVVEASVYCKIETRPPVQFGLNGKNLDLIYSGHDPWEYGLALRKWIFGANGLAYEMILPTKAQGLKRTCVSMDKLLIFFRK